VTSGTGLDHIGRIDRRTGVCGRIDRMFPMTISAGRGIEFPLSQSHAMDTFAVGGIDLQMTTGTDFPGESGLMKNRAWICMMEDIVRTMAILADRSPRISPLVRHSMDALFVLLVAYRLGRTYHIGLIVALDTVNLPQSLVGNS